MNNHVYKEERKEDEDQMKSQNQTINCLLTWPALLLLGQPLEEVTCPSDGYLKFTFCYYSGKDVASVHQTVKSN